MTSLQSEPCEPECNEVTEFLFTIDIESFQMQKAEKFRDFEKQLTFTWDGNVIKSIAKESTDELLGKKELIIYASPKEMFKKLRYSPIMLNFMAVCEDFGTIKLPISQCFCESILCNDFKTQALQNDFKFYRDGIETACMSMSFYVEKVSRDSVGNTLKSLKDANEIFQKNLRKKMRARVGDEDDDEVEPCADFACLSELPEHCKKSLELGEHVYRIVNGHLINLRDKKGICGETCEVARKYCAEKRKVEADEKENPQKVPSPIDLQKLFASKPPNKLGCQKFSDEDLKKFSESSLNCEKLLKSKDMAKYFEEQMKKVRENFDAFSCGDGPKVGKRKCKKKKKSKKYLESEFNER